MKVLQVNSVYRKGSTGKIVYDIHTALTKQGITSIVCYGRGERIQENNVYKTCGELYSKFNHFWANITGLKYGGCFYSTCRLIYRIKKEKPDIVHLHCLNGYYVNIYRLIRWLKANHIKTVLTLHAEFMHTGGCGHSMDCEEWKSNKGCGQSKCPRLRTDIESWLFDRTSTMWRYMKSAFQGFDEDLIVTSVSPWLKERAEISSILRGKRHCTVLNGIDTNVFHSYGLEDSQALKAELNIGAEKVVFHASAFFSDDPMHIKGGYYLIELAKQMPEVIFVVAGNGKNQISVPNNVILLGRVGDQIKLARLYSMADITVLTSKKETFSMIVAESLSCGTPIVGFNAGAPERIGLKGYCKFVEYGDLNGLKQSLLEILDNGFDAHKLEYNAQIYAKEHMVAQYYKCYLSLYE